MKRFAISRRDVLTLVVLTLIIQAIEYGGWLAAIDGRFLNSRLTHARLYRGRPSQDALYVVKIDDDAYEKCFDSKSPLQPDKLQEVVQTITSEAHPAVVGVDILTDASAYRAAYQRIAATLNRDRGNSIWISGAEDTAFERTNFLSWLFTGKEDDFVVRPTAVLGYEPPDSLPAGQVGWGTPIYPRDEDLQLRRFPRQVVLSSDPAHSSNRREVPTWARLVAQEYCQTHSCGPDESAAEVYMNFTANPPEQFALQELFDCSNPKAIRRRKTGGEAFWHTAGNRIILIGGTFQRSNDFYNTPVGLLSGLELNAYAIASELDGSGIRAVRQPWAVLLDLAVGYLVLLVVRKTEHRRWLGFRWLIKSNEPRLAIVVSVVLWIIAFYIIWLFANAYVLGVAGVILGILLDPFANILRTNPRELGDRHS